GMAQHLDHTPIQSAFGDGRALAKVLRGQPVRIVSLTTITRARMYKRRPGGPAGVGRSAEQDAPRPVNPLYDRGVVKIAQRQGLIAADYARAVIAQRKREAEAAGRSPAS